MVSSKLNKMKNETKKPDKRQKQSMLWTGRCDLALRVVFYLSLVGGATVFLPDSFYDGFEVPKLFLVQLGALTMVFLLLFRSALKGSLELSLPYAAAPLAALFLLCAASIGWGINPLLGLEELYRVGTLAGFCFFAFYLYRNREIASPLYFILFASLVLAVWALLLEYNEALRDWIYPYYKTTTHVPGRPSSFYHSLMGNQGNPNFMMHILALSAPMALGALVQELVSPRRTARSRLILFLLAMAVATPSFCILSSQNRSGLLALFAGIGFFSFILILKKGRSLGRAVKQALTGPRGHRILALLALAVLCTAIFFASTSRGRRLGPKMKEFASERLDTWVDRFGALKDPSNSNVYSRVVFLEAGARMIREDPLLGQGIGQFVLNFPGYKSEQNWYIFYMMHPPIMRWVDMTRQSHNEFLQVCLAVGLVGLALFLSFWIILFILVFRYFSRGEENRFRYLVLGSGAGVFGTLVNGLLTFPLQTVTSATFFWATVGVLLAACTTSSSGLGWLTRERTWFRLSLGSKFAKRLLIFGSLAFTLLCVSQSVRLIKARYLIFNTLKTHAYDLDYSIKRCKDSVRLVPYHFETHHVLAFLYMYANDTTGARRHFERTIELAPYFPEPYQHLPKFYLINGDPARAEAVIQRFYDFHPPNIPNIDYPYLDYLLGSSILRDTTGGRFEEAEKLLKKSHTRDADMTLGIAYYQRERYDEAKMLFEQWSRDRGRSTNTQARLIALKYLGLISMKKAQWETARETFEKVSRIAGENSPEFSQLAEESRVYLEYIQRRLVEQNSR